MELGIVSALSLLLVAATVIVHYEFLRGLSGLAEHLTVPRRGQILVVIGGVFLAHLAEVTLYAIAYYAVQTWMGLGRIDGEIEGGALDFFYFSITTYTTLGVGDLHPRGPLRLIAGVESLNGLVLIGWSASFTYLEMARFWEAGPLRSEYRVADSALPVEGPSSRHPRPHSSWYTLSGLRAEERTHRSHPWGSPDRGAPVDQIKQHVRLSHDSKGSLFIGSGRWS